MSSQSRGPLDQAVTFSGRFFHVTSHCTEISLNRVIRFKGRAINCFLMNSPAVFPSVHCTLSGGRWRGCGNWIHSSNEISWMADSAASNCQRSPQLSSSALPNISKMLVAAVGRTWPLSTDPESARHPKQLSQRMNEWFPASNREQLLKPAASTGGKSDSGAAALQLLPAPGGAPIAPGAAWVSGSVEAGETLRINCFK